MRLTAFLTLLVSSPLVLASGVTGKWTGKILLTPPKFPASYSTKQKQDVIAQMARVKKTTFLLNVLPNKTFTILMTAGIRPTPHDTSGVWTLAGKTLTLKPANPSGIANSDEPLVLNLSADGKKLTKSMRQKMGTVQFVFTRR